MLRNAETRVSEVASRLKVSARSVEGRLNEMMGSAAVFVIPMVDQRSAGGASYRLVVVAMAGNRSEVGRMASAGVENLQNSRRLRPKAD